MQAFDPRLSAALFARWPDRVVEVLGHDEERAWLLLADAGTPIGEAAHAHEHLAHGVPDLRVATLPARAEPCGELAAHDLPETMQHDDLHVANVWARQRDHLPEAARPEFDRCFAFVLRRAIARTHQ